MFGPPCQILSKAWPVSKNIEVQYFPCVDPLLIPRECVGCLSHLVQNQICKQKFIHREAERKYYVGRVFQESRLQYAKYLLHDKTSLVLVLFDLRHVHLLMSINN